MKHFLEIKTPAQSIAQERASSFTLKHQGFPKLNRVYWNLPVPALCEEIVFRGEGRLAADGPVLVDTGRHTDRSPNDAFITREASTENHIGWGQHNRPFSPAKFSGLLNRLHAYLMDRDVFVQDVYAGADPGRRVAVRVITELAWHSLFGRHLFFPAETIDAQRDFAPDFTVLCVPSFQGAPEIDGSPSQTFIALSLGQRLALIGNTAYAGEIKRAVITYLSFTLPRDGVLTLNCAANVGPEGDPAVFFGLPGTGKTTLAADPRRRLLGDDAHGWSDEGIFNLENGCYARVAGLTAAAAPQLHPATRRFGSILENVAYDPLSRIPDLGDVSRTDNARCACPLAFLDQAVPEQPAGHPRHIVLLVGDASGSMPPIARLTPEQAVYQFISGYSARIGTTKAGKGAEPEAVFNPCFGAPSLVLPPGVYADLLLRKITRHGINCWLLNTGWVGRFGSGKRIGLPHSRAALQAAIEGALDKVKYRKDPVFGFSVPLACPNVPEDLLHPERAWRSKDAYAKCYRALAFRFAENFKKYKARCPAGVAKAGPKH